MEDQQQQEESQGHPVQAEAPKPAPPPQPSDPVDQWKSLSRKNESEKLAALKERDQLREQIAQMEQASLSEQEKAVAKAVREAEQRGRDAARAESVESTGRLLLGMALRGRGVDAEAAERVVAATNFGAFVKDGDLDSDQIAAHADLFVPAGAITTAAVRPQNPRAHGHGSGERPSGRMTGEQIRKQFLGEG